MAKKAAKKTRIKKTVEPELVELGKRIKELRLARGYSSAEIFAYDHKLSRTSYTQCERGTNLTYMSLRRLLDIFDVSVQEFFEGFKK
jgi:transcriptional regulator with XRE-family HTH domain